MHNTTLIIIAMSMILAGCAAKVQSEKNTTPAAEKASPQISAPPCIIYRTRNDYFTMVAIELSADRKRVVSYPDVLDIRRQGDGVYPVRLSGGFLLDNRGIGPGVAFLKMTYQEYAALEKTPRAEELFEMVRDDDPLLEMYDCGSRSAWSDPVVNLNAVIEKGDFSGFKKLR